MAKTQMHVPKATNDSAGQGVIAWFIYNPVAANLLMVAILFAGVLTALNLRIEGFPSVDPSIISVDVAFESGDASQAEESIAIKIEEALLGTKGIRSISSSSTSSGVNIQIESTIDYDLDKLNTDVKNVVDGINSLPSLAEKPVISQQKWEQNALWISVYGDTSQRELQAFSRELESALLELSSVNNVNKAGWKTPEIAIEVDEKTLQAYQLNIADIVERVRQESLNETSGELRSQEQIILLKADKQRFYQQDFADITILQGDDGSIVKLSDIASITDGFQETPETLSRYQGLPAINLEVRVDRDSNIVAIADEARALVAQWQQSQRLPDNIRVELWMDQSINMLDRLSLVLENGLIGIVLVIFILSIFLNVKVALWVGLGLPVCFAGGLMMMGGNFFDLTLNQLTTFGFVLVLGILVDDAVVVGESVYSTQQQLGRSVKSTVIGVNRVAIPTMFGVLTTVAAFYPLSLVDGRLGKLFSQFALVCTACLVFSLIESKFILPAHLRNLDTQRKDKKNLLRSVQRAADTLVLSLNQKVYRPVLNKALHYRYQTLSVFVSVFILVVGMLPSGKVAFNFFPDIPEETVNINFSIAQGAGFAVAYEQVDKIEQLVAQLNRQWLAEGQSQTPIIKRVYALVSDGSSGTVTIELNAKEQRNLDSTGVANALRKVLVKSEGLQELLVSLDDFEDKDFVLTFLSNNTEVLANASEIALAKLHTLAGVEDIFNNLAQGQAQLKFELTAQGRALGLTTESLAQQIQQSFYGAEVQRLQRGKDEIKVRVRYPASQRQDITDLAQARVRTPNGSLVSLSTVATFNSEYVVTEINRKDGKRAASLSANIDESIIEADEIYGVLEQSVFPELRLAYPDLQIIEDGDAAEEDESANSLVAIFSFSLLLIYVLVAIPLKSYWQPIVIMSAIPFGIVGAILGHWYMGLAISILSINGILALSGVVVNDSLLLVNQYNLLRRQGQDVHRALLDAGCLRMRAILLTSITTVLGLVSLLLETSSQAQFLVPAATSLAFGISFATLISLILVPVVMLVAYDVKRLSQTLLSFLRTTAVEVSS